MTLVISAQDIKGISLGLVDGRSLKNKTEITGEPDRYLARLDETMKEWGVSLDDIGRVVVVAGPGAFTASRVSVTLANAIAFARRLPIVALENPGRWSLEQLVDSLEWGSAVPLEGFAVPVYDRPPHITLPKPKG